MSADWEVGDAALCINAKRNSKLGTAGDRLRQGAVYTVENPFLVCWRGDPVLVLEEVKSGDETRGFNQFRFVKVTPPKADAFDRETIELMNRKPVEALS